MMKNKHPVFRAILALFAVYTLIGIMVAFWILTRDLNNA
jgi:hypothetical protein